MGTIVVGVAGTAELDHGLVWALQRASVTGDTVDAVHAWEPIAYGADPASGLLALAPDALESAARDRLEKAVATAVARSGSDVAVRSRLECGGAAGILERCSRTADLVVVTARPMTLAGRFVHGSVASALLHHAACPVVVVPVDASRHGADPERILVGADFAPASQHALDWAAEEAARNEAPLIPAFVRPPLGEPLAGATTAEDLDRDIELRLRARTPAGKDVQPRVLVGSPGEELVELAHREDLLVVGSRGRSGLAGWLLGSTSSYVVRHAPCPVVVVREHPQPTHA